MSFNIVIPVALPSSGPGLLRAACAVSPVRDPLVHALHVVLSTDVSAAGAMSDDAMAMAAEALQPLLEAAEADGIAAYSNSLATDDVAKGIADLAHAKGASLIVMGWHKPVVSQSILSGPVNDVMRQARTDVAVYLERQFRPARSVLVPYVEGAHDRAALILASNIAWKSDVSVTILHVVKPGTAPAEAGLRTTMVETFDSERVRLQIVESDDPLDAAVRVAQDPFDLIVVGISEAWGLEPSMFSNRHERLARECPGSLLMVRSHLAPMGASSAPGLTSSTKTS